MTRMPDIEAEAAQAVAAARRELGALFRHHHAAPAATQTPAAVPATMEPATAGPATGGTMSLATLEDDLKGGVAAVEAEIAKFKQNLPGYVADAKQLAASPLGQLAAAAAQHVASGVLPPEALAIVESGAAKLYNDILSLYTPAQGTAQTAAATQNVAPAVQ